MYASTGQCGKHLFTQPPPCCRGAGGRTFHHSCFPPVRTSSSVALFRVATSSAARRRIFAYLSFARARAAARTSSGGSTMQVSTYWRRELVRANWVWPKVKSDCTSLAIFARVAAIRASSWAVASVLSPCRSSFSQAVRIKARSERKPRSLAAERTRSRNSLLGNSRFRSIRCFFIRLPPFPPGGTFVPQIARIPPPTKDVKQFDLSPKSQHASPHSFMFQYPRPTTNNPRPALAFVPILYPSCCYLSPTVPELSLCCLQPVGNRPGTVP